MADVGVRLDRLRADDAPIIADTLSCADTARWLSALPFPYGMAEAQAFVADASADEYAIRICDEFAGVIRGDDGLGYWLLPRFRGQGIAQRAAVLALSRSFAQGRDTVRASHHRDNHPSARLLGRLGFGDPQQGTIFVNALQREMPHIQLRLTRADFARLHGVSVDTARLRLDGIGPNDIKDLYRIATDPQIAPMLLRFYPGMPVDEFRKAIPVLSAVPPFRLAIRHNGKIIGSIGIGDLGNAPQIFYFLSPQVWGQGLGGEALQAFLGEIDARFALPVVSAEVFADNPASARLLQVAGFHITGQRMMPSKGRPAPAPGLIMQRRIDG